MTANKFDAKYSYKQDFGYFPGWASIGGIIVGGENRDGNTNVRFHQEDTLRRIMDRVTSELGVVIERFRADCGSFSKEIIQTVEPRCNTETLYYHTKFGGHTVHNATERVFLMESHIGVSVTILIAAVTTAVIAGMDPIVFLQTLGKSFVSTRTMPRFPYRMPCP